ncbi:1514_t:CDS:2, partial [Dentiscutata erythropus]
MPISSVSEIGFKIVPDKCTKVCVIKKSLIESGVAFGLHIIKYSSFFSIQRCDAVSRYSECTLSIKNCHLIQDKCERTPFQQNPSIQFMNNLIRSLIFPGRKTVENQKKNTIVEVCQTFDEGEEKHVKLCFPTDQIPLPEHPWNKKKTIIRDSPGQTGTPEKNNQARIYNDGLIVRRGQRCNIMEVDSPVNPVSSDDVVET